MKKTYSLFIFLLLFSGCLRAKKEPPPSCLRISFFTEPATLDPRKSSDFTSATLICMLFEGLTRNLQEGPKPALAQTIDISKDLCTYTFHLRPSTWSDGFPLVAQDFEAAWKAQIDPQNGSACAYLFYPIRNAEKAFRGEVSMDDVGICCLNEATLQVTLERPTPYFLDLVSFPSYFPAPLHAEGQFELWKQGSSEFVSNGPFCIAKHQVNHQILLKKNNHFWAKQTISLGHIDIAILPNSTVAFKMFEQGELDWIGGSLSPLPIDSLQMIRNKYSLQFDPRPATTFCTFNLKNPFLQNKNLRKALSLAINRSDIVHRITQMGETPAFCMIPPALLPPKQLFSPFDPEMAKQLLEKALQEMGISRQQLHLTLLYGPKSPEPNLAQAIQSQWKEVLDLPISLEQRDPQTIKDALQQKDYEICLTNWIAQFTDPINILERFQQATQLKNYPGWQNPDFVSLLEESHLEADPVRRYELLAKAEEIFAEEMPLAPIYHWSQITLWSDRIQDKPMNRGGAVLFEFLSIKDPLY